MTASQTDSSTNTKFVETEEGWERRDDAKDAAHKSRIDWERAERERKWKEEIVKARKKKQYDQD